MSSLAARTAATPRMALAHDYVTELGGAERVLVTLLERYADAPLLTSAVRAARELMDGGTPLIVRPVLGA